ncbi:glycosyltransferase [uncultured Desulfosarcina sp.]|uniref:glycosyltransferase n=1 Tax=uncultured Desulfosarcina sp. TaxID=218289 RepID=UPI0029C61B96|nr:glycosyltransferase [uncultured Desulfosarcina sp.]
MEKDKLEHMPKPINILHLVYKLTYGGAERILVNIVNRSNRRFRHVICSLANPDVFAETLQSQAQVVSLNKREGNDPRIPWKIASLCREHDIDLIHSISWSTYIDGYLGGLMRGFRRPRFIFAFHGKTISDLLGIPHRRIWAQRLLALGCDAIVAPSQQMLVDYSATFGVAQKKISLLYNGVDEKEYRPRIRTEDSRAEFGFTEDDIVIGCVARLDPVKNLPSLIRSFARVNEAVPKSRLMIVGGGDQYDQLHELVSLLNLHDSIVLTRMRADSANCMRAMDIYILPSLYEGFSVTILEAMATAMPVLAGRVGGTPELVEDGVNGYLFEIDDTQEERMAALMIRLCEDAVSRQKMGRRGRERVLEKFTISGMVREYERLFTILVDK